MIAKLHFALSLLLSYILFYYLLYFDKVSSILLAIIVALFSSLPDLDWKIYSWSNKQKVNLEKRKILKYLCYPYYLFLQLLLRIFRHRTTTHSLLFALIFFILGFLLFPVFYLIGLAILLHIFEDLFTVSGVPLFFPLFKRSYKIPVINTRKHRKAQIAISYLCYFLLIFMFLFL